MKTPAKIGITLAWLAFSMGLQWIIVRFPGVQIVGGLAAAFVQFAVAGLFYIVLIRRKNRSAEVFFVYLFCSTMLLTFFSWYGKQG